MIILSTYWKSQNPAGAAKERVLFGLAACNGAKLAAWATLPDRPCRNVHTKTITSYSTDFGALLHQSAKSNPHNMIAISASTLRRGKKPMWRTSSSLLALLFSCLLVRVGAQPHRFEESSRLQLQLDACRACIPASVREQITVGFNLGQSYG